MTVDFSRHTTPNDRVAVIATVPLTDNETWQQMTPGSLVAFRHGAPEPLGDTRTVASQPFRATGNM